MYVCFYLQILKIEDILRAKGINLLGGFSTETGEFDTILQNCRSVVVMANGGSLLFEEFVKDLKANTHHLTSSDHPFDDFIKRTIEKIPNQKTLLEDRSHENRWVMCSQTSSKINLWNWLSALVLDYQVIWVF